jgi:hypothetical protein
MKYHRTTQKDVSKFFKKNKDEDDESTDDENEKRTEKTANELPKGDMFKIVEPIETVVGEIGKFILNEDTFPIHPAMAFFGKRRTGKTFTLRWWMYNCFRKIPFGVCFTNTSINGFWQTYIPPWLVFQGLDLNKMDALINRQKKLIAKWKEEHKAECKKNPDAYKSAPELAAFCILDDVIADRVAMQWNKDINTFFVEGRHLCISVFITTQHVKGIGPMLRGNLDVACFQPIFQREARMVLADLFGGFMERNDFIALMDEIVVDENLPDSTPKEPKKFVRTMVCNDFENTHIPQIKFHWSSAENPDEIEPGWRLCHEDYWKEQENSLGHKKVVEIDIDDILDEVGRR